jgi:hypothetical protein
MAGSRTSACECYDKGCKAHLGRTPCPKKHTRTRTLYRVDMEDRTGTHFCGACAADAMDSGLFSSERQP